MKYTERKSIAALVRDCIVPVLTVLFAAHLPGAVKYRALLSNTVYNRTQAQIMLFDVSPTSWEYVRTVVHPFDGHCRTPGAAVLVGDVVYVTEWAGWDDRKAAVPSSARILKYDLEGNYLGVHVAEILDPAGKKVNRVEAIVVSPDGKHLYVSQPGNGNDNKCYIYRFKVSDGSGGAVLGPFLSPVGPICMTSDGKTVFVVDTDRLSGQVYAYAIDGDTFTLVKTYSKTSAVCAYLDETDNRLYLSGVNSGITVYDYADDSADPLFTYSETGHYPQIRKVGGELYATYMGGGRVLRLTYGEDGKLSSSQVMPNTSLVGIYGLNRAYMFNEFAVEDTGVKEIARYKFDEEANAPVYANSISSRYPIRAYRTQSGAVGVSGGALYFGEGNASAVIEGSGGMIGGDYGIFMWFGTANQTDTLIYLFSNSMKNQNKGAFSLMMDCGKLHVRNSFITTVAQTVSGDVLRDGKYHHIGVVKKNNTIDVWLDGEKVYDSGAFWSLGLDDSMDFVIGASADGHERFLVARSFFDDIRFFDGAPTDEAIMAMYDEYKDVAANLEVPVAPAAPVHDPSVAETYGTVVSHSFAHQTPRTPPALAVQSNGDYWLLYGSRTIPSSKDSAGTGLLSQDKGVTWKNWTTSVYVYLASPFECKEDGEMYALGRTAYDRGSTGYSICYNNPTNGCDGRVGFSSFTMQRKQRTGFFTNDVNRAVLRIPNKPEPDLATEQEIYPGAGHVSGGRFYLSYLAKDKVGLISGAATAEVGFSDFRPEVASVVSTAENPFPGPVFTDPAGKVSVFVPAGVNASGVATVDIASRDAIGDELAVVEEGIELPGSDRPFAVKYDPVRRQYWAATTPDGTSLCLYASPDLKEWGLARTVFTVSDAATTRVSNPSFDISGNDLVLAFNLACPDGGPALRSLDDPNYVMVRKVQSFRRDSPWQNGTVVILR